MLPLVNKYNSLGEAQKKRGLIASLIVLGLIGIWLSSQEDTESAGPLIPPEIITPVSSNIYVHVVGEVSAPGLYQLPVGSRACQGPWEVFSGKSSQQLRLRARLLTATMHPWSSCWKAPIFRSCS